MLDEIQEYIAIGQVVMNRVANPTYPLSVKAVILQDNQFSCFNENDPNNDKIFFFLMNQTPLKTYQVMLSVAVGVIGNLYADLVHGAMNYVAKWFYEEKKGTGHWSQRMRIAFKAGGHVFLKEP